MKKELKKFCAFHSINIKQFYGKEKVGGSLDLVSVTTLPDGFKNVKSWKAARVNNQVGEIETPKNKLLVWQDGKYIKADGIFTEVVNKRNNAYRVKKINSQKEFYLVTDGKTHAHGDTLKKATEDFNFKLIAEKIKKDPITKDTVITIQYYRIVTGACEFGCKEFVDKHKLKDSYKAKDLLPILEKHNAYGLDRIKSLITF